MTNNEDPGDVTSLESVFESRHFGHTPETTVAGRGVPCGPREWPWEVRTRSSEWSSGRRRATSRCGAHRERAATPPDLPPTHLPRFLPARRRRWAPSSRPFPRRGRVRRRGEPRCTLPDPAEAGQQHVPGDRRRQLRGCTRDRRSDEHGRGAAPAIVRFGPRSPRRPVTGWRSEPAHPGRTVNGNAGARRGDNSGRRGAGQGSSAVLASSTSGARVVRRPGTYPSAAPRRITAHRPPRRRPRPLGRRGPAAPLRRLLPPAAVRPFRWRRSPPPRSAPSCRR